MNGLASANTLLVGDISSSGRSQYAQIGHLRHQYNSGWLAKQALWQFGHTFIYLLSHKSKWSNYEV